MAQQMLAYTRQQPDVWMNVLNRRKEITATYVAARKDLPLSRLVFVGSGSSYTASLVAAETLENLLGVECSAVEPTRLTALLKVLDKEGTVLCVCSQSGKSTSTLAAMESIRAVGFQVFAVTSNAASPVASAADCHVLIECGEELVGPKTKGMTTSALTLILMGIELGLAKGSVSQADYERIVAAYERSFCLAAENIEHCVRWCDEHHELAQALHMIIVADGMALPPALEGALKLLETLYMPVTAYEFEEYLHGVACTLNPQSWLTLVTREGENRKRFLALADFSAEHGGHNVLISLGTPLGREGELNLLTSGNDMTLPFEAVLPFHAMSALISEVKGHNCDKPLFTDFAHRMQTKAGA